MSNRSLRKNGYKITRKIDNTLQGCIYEAIAMDSNQKVCIKQTNKSLHSARESIQYDMRVIVDENIIKENKILKYLTLSKNSYTSKWLNFFQDDINYYLVMEYVDDYNLDQFVNKCHQHIKQKRLQIAEYKKVAKFLCWQIAASLAWLHDDMSCVHHDLSRSNIMVKNCDFVDNKNGTISINPNIRIILIDFGLAEVYAPNTKSNEYKSFKCSLRDCFSHTAPAVYNNILYDSKKSDVWSVGSIFYYIFTGKCLCIIPEEYDAGFDSIVTKTIAKYTKQCHVHKYIGKRMLHLLYNTMDIDENKRYSANQILKSVYFESYYKKYGKKIIEYSKLQKKLNDMHASKMRSFPFYSIDINIYK